MLEVRSVRWIDTERKGGRERERERERERGGGGGGQREKERERGGGRERERRMWYYQTDVTLVELLPVWHDGHSFHRRATIVHKIQTFCSIFSSLHSYSSCFCEFKTVGSQSKSRVKWHPLAHSLLYQCTQDLGVNWRCRTFVTEKTGVKRRKHGSFHLHELYQLMVPMRANCPKLSSFTPTVSVRMLHQY